MAARQTGRSVSGYGHDYECVVSPRKAKFLLNGAKTPEIGWETTLTAATYLGPALNSVPVHLYLQNISGTLVVSCPFCPRAEWGKVFGERYDL